MSATNTEINRFRTDLLRDISDSIESDKTGGIREEKFTEVILEYLEEAGETEAAIPCREIRENSIGNRVHKINGYAFSEGYETVDLFITVFKGTNELGRLYADDIKTGVSLSTRFLQHVITGKMEGIEETAPVFDFVQTMQQISKDIVRVNIYILSDMLIPTEAPELSEMGDIQVHYHFRDIEYIHRIHTSGSGKQAIEINFTELFGEAIPCLPTPEKNADYESYLCVIPAKILAAVYKEHGARLLEQNVRTFLQFRGNINKGIRDTILKEPHMFMAYNNGISATAESIELSRDGKSILSIRDFQIVNGGQTTASIFQTQRKYKDANIGAVCVQVKLTVIRDPGKKSGIVSLISKYANTQNKVSEADLSSNHPFHIELEYLSRKTWTLANSGKHQTRWYYERARGQYNDELSQIDSKAQQKKWLARNPKYQKFAKEDLAKFEITWEMGPWWVVRGRQRNFIEFMKSADDTDVSNTYYEEMIARAILYRTAERLYGTGAKAIGDLRYMVVPYTLSLMRYLTNEKLNLQKIWKQQCLSPELEKTVFTMLLEVNQFMKDTAPGGLIGEWAKKEDCWKRLKTWEALRNFKIPKEELYDEAEWQNRTNSLEISVEQINEMMEQVKIIGPDGWIRIERWGKATGIFDVVQSGFIWKIVRKLEGNKTIGDKDLIRAHELIFQIGAEQLQELLKN